MTTQDALPVYRFSQGDIIRDEHGTLYIMSEYMPHHALASVIRLDQPDSQTYVRQQVNHNTPYKLVLAGHYLASAFLSSEDVRHAVFAFLSDHKYDPAS